MTDTEHSITSGSNEEEDTEEDFLLKSTTVITSVGDREAPLGKYSGKFEIIINLGQNF